MRTVQQGWGRSCRQSLRASPVVPASGPSPCVGSEVPSRHTRQTGGGAARGPAKDQRPGRSCASLPFPLRGASSQSRPGFPYARLARPARLSHRGKPNGARSHRLAAPSRAPYRDYHFHEPSQSSALLELHRFAECKKAVSLKAALMGGSKRLRVRGRVTSPLPGLRLPDLHVVFGLFELPGAT